MRQRLLTFVKYTAAVAGGMLAPLWAYAQNDTPAGSTVNAITMLQNLSNTYPALIQLATAFCVLVGFILTIRGIYYLKVYGELRTMMTTQSSMRVPLTYFLVAAIFMFIPSAYNFLLYTVFHNPNPLSYDEVASTIDPAILRALVGLVQVVGLFAFIRGWMILVAIAHQSTGQHTFGKALTHIIGGILAINIIGFTQMLMTTFGFSFHL